MIDERFQRTKLLIGEENFLKLQAATVAIFGIGGVGSFTVEALARSGIGHLVLIDKDNVDITNINRQIHALTSTVGKSKVELLRERIFEINPAAKVDTVQKFYLPDEPVENFFICNYDYVVDAIDTITAKISLVLECQRRGIKIISSMGAGNKLDPTAFRVADIAETSVCPLARIIRKECRKRGIEKLKVVYSTEDPIDCTLPADDPAWAELPAGRNALPGSVCFVPAAAGMVLAGEVIQDLIK